MKPTSTQNIERYLDAVNLRALEAARRDSDFTLTSVGNSYIDRLLAETNRQSRVSVVYSSDCKPTWPDLENPTSIDHALFLRSRCRYIREQFRQDMRDARWRFLVGLSEVAQ